MMLFLQSIQMKISNLIEACQIAKQWCVQAKQRRQPIKCANTLVSAPRFSRGILTEDDVATLNWFCIESISTLTPRCLARPVSECMGAIREVLSTLPKEKHVAPLVAPLFSLVAPLKGPLKGPY